VRVLLAALALVAAAQELPKADEPPEPPVEWICPMDPDIRSKNPGKCSRCGMKLEAGLPEPVEYPVRLKTTPRAIRPGRKVELTFEILDPKTEKRVENFAVVHERLFHMFLVSEDLQFFVHDHPVKGPDSLFRFPAIFPKPGAYRVLADFYPEGGTPQLIVKTLIASGKAAAPDPLAADLTPKQGENLEVELVTEPAAPLARKKTLLFFRLKPGDGLEPYLGAWGHMLTASEDLIDIIHSHPAFGEGGSQIQFNLIFPRPGKYKIWVQFQRLGVVNTVAFTVPVGSL
jgi:hypothetical protein